ncbi:TetR/AcrR family transcriptional regulator [candidate division KSB1 bacterium]|nr:TetR/AcrR family transcriptional regulator [candidate division KSB1 bacterium]
MTTYTDRQKEIIDVSINIIAEKGIQQLTIKNISKSMKISEPAIYRHFDGKMEILLAILLNFKEYGHSISTDVTSKKLTTIEQLESVIMNHIRQFTAKPALAAVIFSEEIFQNDKRLAEQVRAIMQTNQSMIINIIERGQQTNEIRNDIPAKHLSIMVMGALRLLVTKWRLSQYSFNLQQEGAELWRSLNLLLTA